MEEALLRLIYNYSIKGKVADKRYIDSFIDIVVESRHLDKYLKKTIIDKYRESNSALEYVPDDKVIYIYKKRIDRLFQNDYNSIKSIIGGKKDFYRNIL